MPNQKIQVGLDFIANTQQAKSSIQDLMVSLNKLGLGTNINVKTGNIEQASQAAQQLAFHLQKATDVNTGKLNLVKFNSSLKSSNADLTKLSGQLLATGEAGTQTFMQLAQAIAAANAPAISLSNSMEKLMTTFGNTFRWMISSKVLNGIISTVSNAYNYVQDLDKSLNRIQIVTKHNTDEMAKFAAQANKAAQALSTTTTKYTDAALIYYQQGLGDKEVQARTEATIKLANVTGQTAEIVSSQLTSIWNNFAEGADNLEYFADVITALGATTASSSSEIALALEKFAAVGNAIGLSYEYAASAVATVVAQTRLSAEIVGTAFKTIFARMEQLKLGKALEDGVDLGNYSKALEKIGVKILDASGNLKSMNQILDETGKKWEKLSSAERVATAQTVAGVRQYTTFLALMENYDKFRVNVDTAMASEGELQAQQEIYESSWKASIDRVKSAAEEIYSTLIDDDFFKGFNNFIASLLKSVASITESIGGMKGIILQVLAIVTQSLSTKIAPMMQQIKDSYLILTGRGNKIYTDTAAKTQAMIDKGLSEGNFTESQKAELAGYGRVSSAKGMAANASAHLSPEERAANDWRIASMEVLNEEHLKSIQIVEESAKAAEKANQKKDEAEKNHQRELEKTIAKLKELKAAEIERDYGKQKSDVEKKFKALEKEEQNLKNKKIALNEEHDSAMQKYNDSGVYLVNKKYNQVKLKLTSSNSQTNINNSTLLDNDTKLSGLRKDLIRTALSPKEEARLSELMSTRDKLAPHEEFLYENQKKILKEVNEEIAQLLAEKEKALSIQKQINDLEAKQGKLINQNQKASERKEVFQNVAKKMGEQYVDQKVNNNSSSISIGAATGGALSSYTNLLTTNTDRKNWVTEIKENYSDIIEKNDGLRESFSKIKSAIERDNFSTFKTDIDDFIQKFEGLEISMEDMPDLLKEVFGVNMNSVNTSIANGTKVSEERTAAFNKMTETGQKLRETEEQLKTVDKGMTQALEESVQVQERYKKAQDGVAEAAEEEAQGEEKVKDAQEKVNVATQKANEANEKHKQSLKEQEEAAKRAKDAYEKFAQSVSNHTVTLSEALSSGVSELTNLAMVVNSIKASIDALSNPDLSGWEKFTTIAMSFGMLTGNIKGMVTSFNTVKGFITQTHEALHGLDSVIKNLNINLDDHSQHLIQVILNNKSLTDEQKKRHLAYLLTKKDLGEEAAGISADNILLAKNTREVTINTLIRLKWVAIILAAIAAITFIAIAIYRATSEEYKLNKAIEETSKALEDAKTRTQEMTDSVNNLQSSWDSLKSAKETLSTLTEGTLEWKKQVVEINNTVLELLNNYPELGKYLTNNNGVFDILEEGYTELLNNQIQKANDAMSAQLSLQINLQNLQTRKQMSDMAKSLENSFNKLPQYPDYMSSESDAANYQRHHFFNIDQESLNRLRNDVLAGKDITKQDVLLESLNLNEEVLEDLNLTVADVSNIINENKGSLVELTNKIIENSQKTEALTQAFTDSMNKGNKNYTSGVQGILKSMSPEDWQSLVEVTQGELARLAGSTDINEKMQYAEYVARYKGWTMLPDGSLQDEKGAVHKAGEVRAEEMAPMFAGEINENLLIWQNILKSAKNVEQDFKDLEKDSRDAVLSNSRYEKQEDGSYKLKNIDFRGSGLSYETVNGIANSATGENAEKIRNAAMEYQKYLRGENFKNNAKYSAEDELGENVTQALSASDLGSRQAFDNLTESLKNQNKELLKSDESWQQYTATLLKTSAGVRDVKKAIEDNEHNLKQGEGTGAYAKAIEDINKALNTWLNIDLSKIQELDDNIKSQAEAYNLVKKAIEGNEEALQDLSVIAAKEYVANIYIDPKSKDELYNMLDMIDNEDYTIGTTLDNTGLEAGLQEMLNKGEMSVTEMNRLLSLIGFTPKVEFEEINYNQAKELLRAGFTVYDDQGNAYDMSRRGEMNSDMVLRVPKINSKETVFTGVKSTSLPTKNPKSGGGNKSKEKKDPYHENTRRQNAVEDKLKEVRDKKERASNRDKRAYLQQEIDLNKELINLAGQRKTLAEKEASSNRTILETYGAKFNEFGELTQESYENLVDQMNSTEDEKVKEKIKNAIDGLEKANDEIRKTDSSIRDFNNTIESIKLQDIELSVNMKLRPEQLQQQWYDWLEKHKDDFEFDAAVRLTNRQSAIASFTKSSEANMQGALNVLKLAGYDSIENYFEDLKNGNDKLSEEQRKEFEKYIQASHEDDEKAYEGWNNYFNTFSEWSEHYDKEFSKLSDRVAHAAKIVDSYNNIIDLVGQKNLGITNEQRNEFEEVGITAANRATQLARSQYETYKKESDRLQEDYNKANEFGKKKLEDTLNDALAKTRAAEEEMLNCAAEAIEKVTKAFENKVKRMMNDLAKQMYNGMTIDEFNTSLERQEELDQRYISDYKQIYELSKLNRKIEQQIDSSTNIRAKEKLRDLEEEINNYTAQRGKLSEYDLGYLQKRYDLKVAEIALEEAQNAKSQVRLTRDSEGNYGYTYTANEDDKAKAQQDYEDKLFALQEYNTNAANEMTKHQAQVVQQYIEFISNLDATDENYEQKVAEATEYYSGLMEYYGGQVDTILANNQVLYNADWRKYSEATGYKISDQTAFVTHLNQTTTGKTGIGNILETGEGYYKKFQQTLMVGDGKKSGILGQLMTDHGKWREAVDDAMEKAGLSIDTFADQVNKRLITGDEENGSVLDDLQMVEKEFKKLQETEDKKVQEMLDDLSKQLPHYETWMKGYQARTKLITEEWGNALRAYNAYQAATGGSQGKAATLDRSAENAISANASAETEAKKQQIKSVVEESAIEEHGWKFIGPDHHWYKYPNTKYKYSDVRKRLGELYLPKYAVTDEDGGILYYRINGSKYKLSDINSALDIIAKDHPIIQYASGGYTGEWGSEGRLAMLHQKELVLNADDTKNFLAATDILRDITKVINLQAVAAAGSLGSPMAASISPTDQVIDQHIEINAQFPNATNHNEIEEAFRNLANVAAQYGMRK